MVKEGVIDRMPETDKNETVDVIKRKICTKPTKDNPYMNWLNGDSTTKSEACSL